MAKSVNRKSGENQIPDLEMPIGSGVAPDLRRIGQVTGVIGCTQPRDFLRVVRSAD